MHTDRLAEALATLQQAPDNAAAYLSSSLSTSTAVATSSSLSTASNSSVGAGGAGETLFLLTKVMAQLGREEDVVRMLPKVIAHNDVSLDMYVDLKMLYLILCYSVCDRTCECFYSRL